MEDLNKNIEKLTKLAGKKYDNSTMKKSKVNVADMVKKMIKKNEVKETPITESNDDWRSDKKLTNNIEKFVRGTDYATLRELHVDSFDYIYYIRDLKKETIIDTVEKILGRMKQPDGTVYRVDKWRYDLGKRILKSLSAYNNESLSEDLCDLFGCEGGFFTKDDLMELIDNINDKCPKGLEAVEAYMSDDDKTIEVVFNWDEYGQDSVYKRVDYRGIKKPDDILKFTDELIQMGKDKLGYVEEEQECYAGITDESLCEASYGSEEEIEKDLERFTDGFTKAKGTLTAWDEETRDLVRDILRKNGYKAEVSDGRLNDDEDPSFVFAYEKVEKDESLKESEIEFDDDMVVVIAPNGETVYKGIEDYEPMKGENWKYDYDCDCYRFDGYTKYKIDEDGWDKWDVEPTRDDWDEEEPMLTSDPMNAGQWYESLKESSIDEIADKVKPLTNAIHKAEDDNRGDFYITYSFGIDDDGKLTGGVDIRCLDDESENKAKKILEDLFDKFGYELDNRFKVNPGKTLFGGTHYQIIKKEDDLKEESLKESADDAEIKEFVKDEMESGYVDYNQAIEDVMDQFGLSHEDAEGYVWDYTITPEEDGEEEYKLLKDDVFDFLAYYTDYEDDNEICNHAYDIIDKFGVDYATAEALNREFVEKQLHKYRESLKESVKYEIEKSQGLYGIVKKENGKKQYLVSFKNNKPKWCQDYTYQGKWKKETCDKYVDQLKSLKESVGSKLDTLAYDLAKLHDDYDPYGFDDAYSDYPDSREMNIEKAKEDNLQLLRDDKQTILDWLNEIIEDGDEEYVDRAKKLIDRVNALQESLDDDEEEDEEEDDSWDKEDESLKEDWTHFEFKSGSNPYIAKTEKEKDRILKKYKGKVKEIKKGFYEIDDKNESLKESKSDLATRIADFIIKDGTENTDNGSWCVYIDEIEDKFGKKIFDNNKGLKDRVEKILSGREEIADLDTDDECFDVVFYLDYCPNAESEEDERQNFHLEGLKEAVGKLDDLVPKIAKLLARDKKEIENYASYLVNNKDKLTHPYKDFATRFMWDVFWVLRNHGDISRDATNDANDSHITTMLRKAFKQAGISTSETDYIDPVNQQQE